MDAMQVTQGDVGENAQQYAEQGSHKAHVQASSKALAQAYNAHTEGQKVYACT